MKDQLTHSFCKDISLLKKGLLLGFFLLAVTTLSAQIREIKGIVTSETSEPLPGVAVQIDASGTGTVTWSTSDATVATVSSDGTVTNVYAGVGTPSVTITASCGICRMAVVLTFAKKSEGAASTPISFSLQPTIRKVICSKAMK